MLSKIHLTLTGLLLLAVLAFAGLAATGRLHYGSAEPVKETSEESATGGRYRIEKVNDAREVFEAAGMGGFLGPKILEAWVFKYSGGYLQAKLEAEYKDENAEGEPMPSDWAAVLAPNDALREDKEPAFRREGYIVLTATPSQMPIEEAVAIYGPQVSGILGTATGGPMHALFPLALELKHERPYRLFLSGRPAGRSQGHGYNYWAVHLMPVREPVIPREFDREEFHVGGGKDLQPGKEITLLERKRGNSRIRLRAKFLGDGEVRDFATKTGS